MKIRPHISAKSFVKRRFAEVILGIKAITTYPPGTLGHVGKARFWAQQ